MAVDLDKCTGCGRCALACAQENNMPISADDSNTARKASLLNITMLTNDGQASYPHVRSAFILRLCMHCSHPACAEVCPTGSASAGTDGTSGQMSARCIGCRYCMASCPFKAPAFVWKKPEYFTASLNPDTPLAFKGTVIKCTFCHHLLRKEMEKAAYSGASDREPAYTPLCAAACPSGAIVFGNLKDKASEVSRLAASDRAVRPTAHGADTGVFYLTKRDWLKKIIERGFKC